MDSAVQTTASGRSAARIRRRKQFSPWHLGPDAPSAQFKGKLLTGFHPDRLPTQCCRSEFPSADRLKRGVRKFRACCRFNTRIHDAPLLVDGEDQRRATSDVCSYELWRVSRRGAGNQFRQPVALPRTTVMLVPLGHDHLVVGTCVDGCAVRNCDLISTTCILRNARYISGSTLLREPNARTDRTHHHQD